MKEYKFYKFKWNDNKTCRDRGCFRGCFGSRDTIEELIFLASDKKDAIIEAMKIVSEECIFTEWSEEFLENANNLSLQELREYLHNIDISGGAAFIYWIVEVKTDESVFESGYEEFDDEFEYDEDYEYYDVDDGYSQ